MRLIILLSFTLFLSACSSHLGRRFEAPKKPFLAMAQEPVGWVGGLVPHTLYLWRVSENSPVVAMEFMHGGVGLRIKPLKQRRDIRHRHLIIARIEKQVGKLSLLAKKYEDTFGNDYELGQSNHFARWILDRMPELQMLGWRLSDGAYGASLLDEDLR